VLDQCVAAARVGVDDTGWSQRTALPVGVLGRTGVPAVATMWIGGLVKTQIPPARHIETTCARKSMRLAAFFPHFGDSSNSSEGLTPPR
jgi:hypothetical protein